MSVAAQASLHSIISQLSSPPPDTDDLDYVAVCVLSDDGNALLYPSERDPSLATLLKDSRFRAAIKARTPAIKALLAEIHPDASLFDAHDGTKLPILGSLASTPHAAMAHHASIVRDESALVVWANNATHIAQYFLDLEHRLRHTARLCTCAMLPSLTPYRSLGESKSTTSLDEEFLYTSYQGLFGDSTMGPMYDGPVIELPELDLPFRPLDMEFSFEDDAVMPDDIVSEYAAELRVQGPYATSSTLLPSRVFSSSSRMAMLGASHETEPQTISPSLLHSPYSPVSSTVSPASTSGAPFTPWSADAGALPVWTTSSELQVSPTNTIDVTSISPATKSLGGAFDRMDAAYDDEEAYDSPLTPYTPGSPPRASPVGVSPSVLLATPPEVGTYANFRPKRKRGSAKTPPREAGSPMIRDVKPLPKRRAKRVEDQELTSTRLHALPGRPSPRTRGGSRTIEEPMPSSSHATKPADAFTAYPQSTGDERDANCDESDGDDGDDEYVPIDVDVADEDDTTLEPKPKKGRVDAGSEDKATRGVTARSGKGVTRGKKRRGSGPRTACGSKRGKHKCEECSKTFTRPGDRDRHMNIHRNKKVVCAVCEGVYARPDSYKRHLRPDGTCPNSKKDDIEVDNDPESEEDVPLRR
ncbi:uncharacterized protein B0H18DRAFT_1125983 [Fomitopsis serialis]|uniref:uncharacterized protein n=1 Tax=Fomitopsis serialis TaxID=139415 RepID=UPI0020072FA0|nr:uncharacterized protein B0H18DRAFT_1125983 [Neoantrodia serialis]KAH9913839.1 hypothetical protein B0H18DRAFT_1125983 [Neoantrodia serialis]